MVMEGLMEMWVILRSLDADTMVKEMEGYITEGLRQVVKLEAEVVCYYDV